MTMHDVAPKTVALEESALWNRRGSWDEAELKQLLAEICETLAPLHERGRVHGRISPPQIRVTEGGAAFLQPGPNGHPFSRQGPDGASSAGLESRSDPARLYGVLPDGYAAFEQYMEEAAWPLGPWTDVHALSAVAYALITGDPPQDAVKRMAHRADVRFDEAARQRFSAKLLAAVQRGLSDDAQARQQSVDEFLLSLGVIPPWGARQEQEGPREDNGSIPPAQAGAAESPGTASGPISVATARAVEASGTGAGRPVGWGLPLAVLVLLAVGGGLWLARGAGDEGPLVAAAEPEAPRHAGQAERHAEPPSEAGLARASSEALLTAESNARRELDEPVVSVARDGSDVSGASGTSGASGASGASATSVAPATPEDAGQAFSGLPESALFSPEHAREAVHETTHGAAHGAAQTPASGEAAESVSAASGAGEATGSDARPDAKIDVQADAKADANADDNADDNAGTQSDAKRVAEAAAAEQTVVAAPEEPPSASGRVAVSVDVRPWGEVFIDGVSRGVSPPLRSLSLPPGSYDVRIQNGDLPPAQSRLTVDAGRTAAIRHTF